MNHAFFVLFSLAWGLASSARADVVTDLGVLGMERNRGAVWIYFRDDQGVTQARCPSATGVRDRNTCRGEARTVESNGFILKLLAFGPTDLEDLAAKAREHLTRVERVELRIDELLNTPADDADVLRLEAALATNQQDQAALETRKAEGDDQARQIRNRLNDPGADPDLGRQLAQVEATILDLRRQIETKAKERNALAVELIRARSQGPTNNELLELDRWRAGLVVEWETAQAAYLNAINQASDVRNLVRHLTKSQDMFALELLSSNNLFPELRPFAKKLDTAFEKEAIAEGHAVSDNWYAAYGRGELFDEHEPERSFTISGWDGASVVLVSRIPDLKQQCFDSVDRQDLDYGRFLPAPVALQCNHESGDYYSCLELRELSSASGNRTLQRQIGVTFVDHPGGGYVRLETWQTCYMSDGRNTVWSEVSYAVHAVAKPYSH